MPKNIKAQEISILKNKLEELEYQIIEQRKVVH